MRLREDVAPEALPTPSEGRLYVLRESLRLEADQEVPPHTHPAATEVYVVAAGGGVVEVAGRPSAVSPGDVVVVPAGSVHSIRVGPGGLSFAAFMAFPSLSSFLAYRARRVVQDSPLLAALHRLLRRRA